MPDQNQGRVGRTIAFLILMIWSGFPIALIVLSSFKPPSLIFTSPPTLVFTPTLQNYVRLWREWPEFFHALLNSLVIVVGATLLTVSAGTMAGFFYSRCRNATLAGTSFLLIFVRMIPPIVITLPLFPVVNFLGLSDTHLVLILLYSAFYVSLATWIMKAAIDQIPIELDQAALIDGTTVLQFLRLVVLPLAVPGMMAAATFVIVYSWNEFLFAFIFTTTRAKTTPLILSELLGALDGVQWGVLFAGTTVQLVPILVFVMFVQRYVVAGMMAGSVKG